MFLGSAECDLMTPGNAAAAIKKFNPYCVINAAAYTAVDKAETDEKAALKLNANAPCEIAQAAKESGAKFIHISTDYVSMATTKPLILRTLRLRH